VPISWRFFGLTYFFIFVKLNNQRGARVINKLLMCLSYYVNIIVLQLY